MILMKKSKLLGDMKMHSLLLQGEYSEIIVELLNKPYCIDSVIKIVFMSFCVKNGIESSYRNRKMDFVNIFLDNLSIKFLSHPNEVSSIFAVLDKMKTCHWIKIKSGKITILRDLSGFECEHSFLKKCKSKNINPILEVNKLDDRAFLEEVLRHV